MWELVNEIRKSIVTKCMAKGIENHEDILMVTAKALRSIGYMSVAGFKAGITRKENIRRKLRRR